NKARRQPDATGKGPSGPFSFAKSLSCRPARGIVSNGPRQHARPPMNPIVWDDVDTYITDKLIPHDPVMEGVIKANRAAGLPAIDVSAPQGKFLNLLVRMTGARLVLEIGTLGAYSTIWMARALGRGGRLVTLEFQPLHATVARENIAAAGLAAQVEVRLGRAIDNLPKLEA